MTLLLVAVGAAAGAVLRYVAGQLLDAALPWGTLLVNVTGAFALGMVTGAALDGNSLALWGAGFAGGLTTYSTFAVQTHESGVRRGAIVVLLTLPPAMGACALGYALTR